MNSIIKTVFGFCCLTMAELGHLFGISYHAVNVIAFCYIEPIFTGIMIAVALMSLMGIHVRKSGTIFFWLVVCTGAVLFFTGAIMSFRSGASFADCADVLPRNLSARETDPFYSDQFSRTVHWLQNLAGSLGVSYYCINLLVYVIGMPALCLGSYIILRKTGK